MFRSVLVVGLFVVLSSALDIRNPADFDAIKQKCVNETGADPKKLTALIDVGPIDDKLQCFGACMLKELGVLKADGTIDVNNAISYVSEDFVERDSVIAIVKECADNKGANDCDTALKVFSCLREKKLPR